MSTRLNHTAALLLSMIIAAPMVSADNSSDDSTDRIAAELASAEPKASPVDGAVEITSPSGPLTFHIFSITGQLVKTVVLQSETARIELPRGCYVIKSGRWSKKVLVH